MVINYADFVFPFHITSDRLLTKLDKAFIWSLMKVFLFHIGGAYQHGVCAILMKIKLKTQTHDDSFLKLVIVLQCELLIVDNQYSANADTCTSKVPLVVPWSSLAIPPHLPKIPVVEAGDPPPVLPSLALRLVGSSSLTSLRRTRTTPISRRSNLSLLSEPYLFCMVLVHN